MRHRRVDSKSARAACTIRYWTMSKDSSRLIKLVYSKFLVLEILVVMSLIVNILENTIVLLVTATSYLRRKGVTTR